MKKGNRNEPSTAGRAVQESSCSRGSHVDQLQRDARQLRGHAVQLLPLRDVRGPAVGVDDFAGELRYVPTVRVHRGRRAELNRQSRRRGQQPRQRRCRRLPRASQLHVVRVLFVHRRGQLVQSGGAGQLGQQRVDAAHAGQAQRLQCGQSDDCRSDLGQRKAFQSRGIPRSPSVAAAESRRRRTNARARTSPSRIRARPGAATAGARTDRWPPRAADRQGIRIRRMRPAAQPARAWPAASSSPSRQLRRPRHRQLGSSRHGSERPRGS